jgi:DNA modification methylase
VETRRIDHLPLKDLKGNDRNPKSHDLETINASVGRFGVVETIVLDERTGTIISGHGRAETLRRMKQRGETPPDGVMLDEAGEWLVPVVRGWESRSDLEAGAALIALNRTTELGGWVDESLLDLLDELSEVEHGLDGVGFDQDALDELRESLGDFDGLDLGTEKERPTRKVRKPSLGPGTVTVYHGDCIEVMRWMQENSLDAIVCDPPYGLEFMGKDWDDFKGGAGLQRLGTTKELGHRIGYQGRPTYGTGQKAMEAFEEWTREWATEALRVLKPGGHLIAFGASRTHHRTMIGIEDAGFELRDCGVWLQRQGFPKSHDISKALDKMAGHTQEFSREAPPEPITDEAVQWEGWGTSLKPCVEMWTLARKPLAESSVAANVLVWGTGALNIDACRHPYGEHETPNELQEHPLGRFPANALTMEDDEDLLHFHLLGGQVADYPKAPTAERPWSGHDPECLAVEDESATCSCEDRVKPSLGQFRCRHCTTPAMTGCDCPAPKWEHPDKQGDNTMHPTVKPLALMRHLIRLVTPPGGAVLDPFGGTGTTGEAAVLEGAHGILIERDEDYLPWIKVRVNVDPSPWGDED